jgi:hypothetical protein
VSRKSSTGFDDSPLKSSKSARFHASPDSSGADDSSIQSLESAGYYIEYITQHVNLRMMETGELIRGEYFHGSRSSKGEGKSKRTIISHFRCDLSLVAERLMPARDRSIANRIH